LHSGQEDRALDMVVHALQRIGDADEHRAGTQAARDSAVVSLYELASACILAMHEHCTSVGAWPLPTHSTSPCVANNCTSVPRSQLHSPNGSAEPGEGPPRVGTAERQELLASHLCLTQKLQRAVHLHLWPRHLQLVTLTEVSKCIAHAPTQLGLLAMLMHAAAEHAAPLLPSHVGASSVWVSRTVTWATATIQAVLATSSAPLAPLLSALVNAGVPRQAPCLADEPGVLARLLQELPAQKCDDAIVYGLRLVPVFERACSLATPQVPTAGPDADTRAPEKLVEGRGGGAATHARLLSDVAVVLVLLLTASLRARAGLDPSVSLRSPLERASACRMVRFVENVAHALCRACSHLPACHAEFSRALPLFRLEQAVEEGAVAAIGPASRCMRPRSTEVRTCGELPAMHEPVAASRVDAPVPQSEQLACLTGAAASVLMLMQALAAGQAEQSLAAAKALHACTSWGPNQTRDICAQALVPPHYVEGPSGMATRMCGARLLQSCAVQGAPADSDADWTLALHTDGALADLASLPHNVPSAALTFQVCCQLAAEQRLDPLLHLCSHWESAPAQGIEQVGTRSHNSLECALPEDTRAVVHAARCTAALLSAVLMWQGDGDTSEGGGCEGQGPVAKRPRLQLPSEPVDKVVRGVARWVDALAVGLAHCPASQAAAQSLLAPEATCKPTGTPQAIPVAGEVVGAERTKQSGTTAATLQGGSHADTGSPLVEDGERTSLAQDVPKTAPDLYADVRALNGKLPFVSCLQRVLKSTAHIQWHRCQQASTPDCAVGRETSHLLPQKTAQVPPGQPSCFQAGCGLPHTSGEHTIGRRARHQRQRNNSGWDRCIMTADRTWLLLVGLVAGACESVLLPARCSNERSSQAPLPRVEATRGLFAGQSWHQAVAAVLPDAMHKVRGQHGMGLCGFKVAVTVRA
jgi:hypothetical protein